MRADKPSSQPIAWRRLVWQGCIAVAGIAAIVGSGGGLSVGFPPCTGPYCSYGPLPPTPGLRLAPAEVTATVGTPATFIAVVENIDTPAYQWSRSNDGGASYTALPGATASRLTLPAVNLGDHGARLQVQAWSGGVRQA